MMPSPGTNPEQQQCQTIVLHQHNLNPRPKYYIRKVEELENSQQDKHFTTCYDQFIIPIRIVKHVIAKRFYNTGHYLIWHTLETVMMLMAI